MVAELMPPCACGGACAFMRTCAVCTMATDAQGSKLLARAVATGLKRDTNGTCSPRCVC